MLPKGATPIDFAYAVHTEVGHHCSGARVNKKMVPLRTTLQHGDVVEIITSAGHLPSKDWLKIVKTSKAKNRIRQWLKIEERKRSIDIGKDLLEKELRKTSVERQSANEKRCLAPDRPGIVLSKGRRPAGRYRIRRNFDLARS